MKHTLHIVLVASLLFTSIIFTVIPAQAQSITINNTQYVSAKFTLDEGLADLGQGFAKVGAGLYKNIQSAGTGNNDITAGKGLLQSAQAKINSALSLIIGSIP